jgi:hypothetical protein
MEPNLAGGFGDLRGLRLDLLEQAAGIYLELAYPTGEVPESIRRRLIWQEGGSAEELLSGPPFERAGKAPGRQTPIYALRLGNHRYPHMKLQIQPWPNEAGFMLSVNTHDQVSGVSLGGHDAQAFRELQVENQRLKEAIEQAWGEANLPTFLSYLREYILRRTEDSSSTGAGQDPAGIGPDAPGPSELA